MILGPIATLRVAPHPLLIQPALDVHRRMPANPYPIYEDILPGAEVEGWWAGRWYRMNKLTLDTWPQVEHFQVKVAYHSAWLVPRDLTLLHAAYTGGAVDPPYPTREWLVETGRKLLVDAEAREELREGAAAKATWYQCAGAAMVRTRPWVFLRWAPGCLAGDTELVVNRNGKAMRMTLADLVHKFNGGRTLAVRAQGGGPDRWRKGDTNTQSVDDEGYRKLNRVVHAVSSGVKPVFRVHAGAQSVKATKDHQFSTPTGFKRLEQLKAGDLVHVVEVAGRKEWASEDKVKKGNKLQYDMTFGMQNHPYHRAKTKVRSSRPNPTTSYLVPTHRVVAEALLNGMAKEQFIAAVQANQPGLKFLDPAVYAVHHKDRDTKNNEPDNLEVTTHVEHGREHGLEHNWKNNTPKQKAVAIESIEPAGEEETYDLTMNAPMHNFVASGFVVHNSGKTAGAAFAALSHPGDIVVLCPGKARKEWRTEPGRMRSSIEKFTLLESHVVLPRSDRGEDYEDIGAYLERMRECSERAIVVVGMEALADYLDDLKGFHPSTLIIDEVHDLGDHARWTALAQQDGGISFETAKTTSGEMKRSVAAMSVSQMKSIKNRIVMTGTPLDDGRPRRLWAPLDLLSPGGFGRYGNFRSRYTGLTLNGAGYIDDGGTSNLQELKQRCSMFFFDVSRAETHASLPALRLEVSYLKKDELNAPDAFAAEMRKLAKEAGRADSTGMEARMRMREAGLAEACSMKRGAVRKRAKEFLDTDGKVVVLLSRIAMAERWFEQWTSSFKGVQGWLATGHVSEKERDRIVDAYAEHPGPCFLIGTGHSIGTSKDGMQHSDLAVIAQLPEKPGLWLQWIGRFDRLGGRSPIVWAPLAEGSADDREAARLVRKLGPLERFMDAPELREMADKLGGLDDPDLIDSILDKLLAKGLEEET